MRPLIAALAAIVLLPAIASAELKLQTSDPSVIAQYNDRFSTASNKALIGAAYDWSGVGKDMDNVDAFWAVMISPSYFLTSSHYAPSSGDRLTFYIGNDTSNPKIATVSSTWYTVPGTDLELGKLTSPLPAGVTYYPIGAGGTTPAGRARYVNNTIYVVGQTANRVGMLVGENAITSDSLVHFYNANGDLVKTEYSSTFAFHSTGGFGEADCLIQSGDSGGPSFVVQNGQLVLEGIHYAFDGINNISYDTFVPAYVSSLDNNMLGEQVTVVPEPATMLFLLGAPLLLIRRLRGVRRRTH